MWTSHGLHLHTQIGHDTVSDSVTQTHGWNSVVIWRNCGFLEANLAAGYGVAQLGLVVDEGHDAEIGLDEQGPLQDQDPVSPTGDGVLPVGFLHCLHQLGPEVVQLGK